jgi:hypothetical protein
VKRVALSAAAVLALGLLRCSEREDAAPPPVDRPAPELDAGFDGEAPCAEHATTLRCTGLYTDIRAKTVAPDVDAFAPAFPLWSDGAEKRRWIRLPAGTQIDTSDMDEWVFPVGTKLWKEFSLAGRRIETRLITKLPDGKWDRQVFKWSEDESSADEIVDGERNVRGTTYEIPSQDRCSVCHNGRVDGVLGFEAVSLANDGASGLTLAELVRRSLITKAPEGALTVPGNPTERAALTWLHANCGTSCHSASPQSRANFTYLYMRLDAAKLGSPGATDTYTTSIKRLSGYQPPDAGSPLFRVTPGAPQKSVLFLRASVRDPEMQVQMPPIITHEVDPKGTSDLEKWILALPP